MHPKRYDSICLDAFYTPKGIDIAMNTLSATVKALRKEYNLTQEDLSMKSGVGLRFVRELEQGKPTLRLDKVNQVLELFGMEMGPVKQRREDEA